jgi:hypothetical protein
MLVGADVLSRACGADAVIAVVRGFRRGRRCVRGRRLVTIDAVRRTKPSTGRRLMRTERGRRPRSLLADRVEAGACLCTTGEEWGCVFAQGVTMSRGTGQRRLRSSGRGNRRLGPVPVRRLPATGNGQRGGQLRTDCRYWSAHADGTVTEVACLSPAEPFRVLTSDGESADTTMSKLRGRRTPRTRPRTRRARGAVLRARVARRRDARRVRVTAGVRLVPDARAGQRVSRLPAHHGGTHGRTRVYAKDLLRPTSIRMFAHAFAGSWLHARSSVSRPACSSRSSCPS